MCSSNDRFESRSFKKASVDQLLKEELHVCDLSFLQRFDKEIKIGVSIKLKRYIFASLCNSTLMPMEWRKWNSPLATERKTSSSLGGKFLQFQPGWEVFTVPPQMRTCSMFQHEWEFVRSYSMSGNLFESENQKLEQGGKPVLIWRMNMENICQIFVGCWNEGSREQDVERGSIAVMWHHFSKGENLEVLKKEFCSGKFLPFSLPAL